jgi:hypothetical protein
MKFLPDAFGMQWESRREYVEVFVACQDERKRTQMEKPLSHQDRSVKKNRIIDDV